MSLNNSTVKTNEETDFQFIRLPKKVRLLLNGNERSLLGEMVDYQQMIDHHNESKGNDFQMAISYICRNLDISDKTAQTLVNKLVELDLIIKHSGFKTRTKNTYSINADKICEFEKLSNEQLFELRDKAKKDKAVKTEVIAEVTQTKEFNVLPVTQPVEECVKQQTKEFVSAKSIIDEFNHFLSEKDSRTSISEKILKIIPVKYSKEEKKILIEYAQTDEFQHIALVKYILKSLTE